MSKFEKGKRWAAVAGLALLALANVLMWDRMAHGHLIIVDAVMVSLLLLLFFARGYEGGVKTLVVLAFLTALSVVLSRLLSLNTHSVRVGLGNVPILLAGLLYGPFAGALVGFGADITGALLLSSFGYMPLLGLSPVLLGGLPGLVKPLLLRKSASPLRLGLVVFGAEAVTSVGWTSYCVHLLYGTPLRELLMIRVPLYLLMALAETAVLWLMIRSGIFRSRGLAAKKTPSTKEETNA